LHKFASAKIHLMFHQLQKLPKGEQTPLRATSITESVIDDTNYTSSLTLEKP
jgi:hypothetical protein